MQSKGQRGPSRSRSPEDMGFSLVSRRAVGESWAPGAAVLGSGCCSAASFLTASGVQRGCGQLRLLRSLRSAVRNHGGGLSFSGLTLPLPDSWPLGGASPRGRDAPADVWVSGIIANSSCGFGRSHDLSGPQILYLEVRTLASRPSSSPPTCTF